jgi:predicted amidohydrolase YtcJ
MKKIATYLLLLCCTACTLTKNNAVDTIIHNAVIYTVDSAFTVVEAIAIKDGQIIAVGSNDEILKAYSAKEKYDAQGQAIYPGFNDAHAHFLGYGKSLFEVQLYGTESWEDVLNRVSDFGKSIPAGEWIIGRGWDQNDWAKKKFPNNKLLTERYPNNPVILTRIDGHAAIANQKALELAGLVGKDYYKLTGGEVVNNKDGSLSGLLIDNAVDLVTNVIPKPTKADYEKWLLKAQENCFAQGLTSITDCGLMYNDVEMIDALQKEGKLNMRLFVMLSDDTANYNRYLNKPLYKTDKLYVGGIKVYADGALGSRGACLLKHYSDKPGWSGFLLKDKSYFDSLAAVLVNTNFQMCTHAIGDSANREILNIYNKYLKGKNDKRWRIEHAQVLNTNDFNLFGKAAVVPSVQPTHATSDMYWAGERLGAERLKGAYALNDLLQQNGWLPLGTDFPVEDISPFKTFLAAVFRQDAKGFPATGFQMENALSRENAIRGMTIWAAKAGFTEKETGSLEKGKKADFIILDKDLMKVTAAEVLTTTVKATYSNGKKVY